MSKVALLRLGNVVRLRSGGPNMTVERDQEKTDNIAIHCVWFDNGAIRRDQFPRRALDKVKA